MFWKISLFFLFCVGTIFCDEVQYGWIRIGSPSSTDAISFKIWLRFENEYALEALVDAVSNPKSISYGKHKSSDEIRNMIMPTSEVHKEVKEWLRSVGLNDKRCRKTWDSYSCDDIEVIFAEKLFSVKLYSYTHQMIKNHSLFATEDKLVLPESVQFVTGINLYDPLSQLKHLGRKLRKDFPVLNSDSTILSVSLEGGQINSTTIALYCANGEPTDASLPTWCSNSIDQPVTINIFLYQGSERRTLSPDRRDGR